MKRVLNEEDVHPSLDLKKIMSSVIPELPYNITISVGFDFNVVFDRQKDSIKVKPRLYERFKAIYDSIHNDDEDTYDKLRDKEDDDFESFISDYQIVFKTPQGAFSGGSWDINLEVTTAKELCLFVNAAARSNCLYAYLIAKALTLTPFPGTIFDEDCIIDLWVLGDEEGVDLYDEYGIHTFLIKDKDGKILEPDDVRPKNTAQTTEPKEEAPAVKDEVILCAITNEMGQMMYHDKENEDGAKKQMALILKASAAEFKDYLKSTYKLDAEVKYEIEIDDEECILIPSSLVVIQSDLDSVSRFVEIMFSAAKKAAMTGKLSGIFENTFMNSILPHVCVLCDQCDGTTWADLADKGVKSTIRDNDGEEYGIVLFKRAK